jgi:hypothetical protein
MSGGVPVAKWHSTVLSRRSEASVFWEPSMDGSMNGLTLL